MGVCVEISKRGRDLLITKGATSTTTARTPAFFYSSARQGVRDLLEHGPEPQHGRSGVLLPAYVGWSANEGSGVFDPIKESGRPFEFYRLHADLSADVASIEHALASGRFQYLILIHYFGRLNSDFARIRDIADRAGVIVIDDLAHGFFSAARSRATLPGQVSVYSLHKQFALGEGGMVVYRDTALVRRQRSDRDELAARMLDFDWEEIAVRRRDNFRRIQHEIEVRAPGGVTFMWPELQPNEVPQSLPVLLKSADRDRVYAGMNAVGFGMVSLYHTLIPDAAGVDETVAEIARTIINFPVHQDVEQRLIPDMVSEFVLALAKHSEGER